MITKAGQKILVSVIGGFIAVPLTDEWTIEIGSSAAPEDETQVDLVAKIAGGETSDVSIKTMSYMATSDTLQISGEILMPGSGTIREVGLRDSNGNLIIRKLYEKDYAANDAVVVTVTCTCKYGGYSG